MGDVLELVKLTICLDSRTSAEDYAAFNDVWEKPNGGLHMYLFRFLTNPDPTFQHIAVWTVVQLLESGGVSSVPTAVSIFATIPIHCQTLS